MTEEYKYKITESGKICDRSLFGALESGGMIIFELRTERQNGFSDPVLNIHSDGMEGEEKRISLPLRIYDISENTDIYRAEIETDALQRLSGNGLFWYYYEADSFEGKVRLGGERATELLPLDKTDERQLFIYDKDFRTPDFIKGGMIYHVFVDRFFSSGKCEKKEGAVINPDWYNGIPQYAEYRGAPLKNNEFFGGDLYGVIEKLGYLKELGVTVIYLSPVFESPSNHKYDTADYMKVDSMFGGDEALQKLFDESKKLGITVILDGVFNHTGADSVYFNKYKNYGDGGAYYDKASPFGDWYIFENYPDKYECWWGIDILPKVDPKSKGFREYILGENGVVRKYMRMGAGGFRLDVADELTDDFIKGIRNAVREENPDGIVLGEVWEDASNKIAYGKRRRYLSGFELDSVMNYPLRDGIIGYIKYGDAEGLRNATEKIYRHYPKCVSDSLMNFLGTHDTERILTVLGGEEPGGRSPRELSGIRMTEEQREKGTKRLKNAFTVLSMMFGVPSVFYGDEAGSEGYHDPFCRRPYPWNNRDEKLVSFFKKIGRIRKTEKVLKGGYFRLLECDDKKYIFERFSEKEKLTVVLTRNEGFSYKSKESFSCILSTSEDIENNGKMTSVTLKEDSAYIFKTVFAREDRKNG